MRKTFEYISWLTGRIVLYLAHAIVIILVVLFFALLIRQLFVK